jgi:protein-arginine kinase
MGLFRIRAGRDYDVLFPPSMNVWWKDKTCCLVLKTDGFMNIGIPYYDHIIAQVLLIKANPEEFLQKANVTRRT